MAEKSIVAFMAVILFLGEAYSQCDYIRKRYDVRMDSNLVYGVAPTFNLQNDTLRLDLYKPINDANIRRPLLVWIHGGGFIDGNRRDDAALCRNFAARGYAVASISYRLGFVPPLLLTPPWAFDRAEVERAMYRALQDSRGAIRWLKARHAIDSTDTANVFVAGGSAGAITALAVGFMDQESYKPASADSINAIFNTYTYVRPDLGPIQGTLNLNGYDARIKGVGNVFGAIGDTAWITASGPAVVSYHQTNDPVVACYTNQPYWGIGLGINTNYPWMHGSAIIDRRLQSVGYAAERRRLFLYNGNQHAVHDAALVDTLFANFFGRLICGTDQGVVAGRAVTTEQRPISILRSGSVLMLEPSVTALKIFNLRGGLVKRVPVCGRFIDVRSLSLPQGAFIVATEPVSVAALISVDSRNL